MKSFLYLKVKISKYFAYARGEHELKVTVPTVDCLNWFDDEIHKNRPFITSSCCIRLVRWKIRFQWKIHLSILTFTTISIQHKTLFVYGYANGIFYHLYHVCVEILWIIIAESGTAPYVKHFNSRIQTYNFQEENSIFIILTHQWIEVDNRLGQHLYINWYCCFVHFKTYIFVPSINRRQHTFSWMVYADLSSFISITLMKHHHQ